MSPNKIVILKTNQNKLLLRSPHKIIEKKSEIRIEVDLNYGSSSSKVWTCDLTKKYIEINADYRS